MWVAKLAAIETAAGGRGGTTHKSRLEDQTCAQPQNPPDARVCSSGGSNGTTTPGWCGALLLKSLMWRVCHPGARAGLWRQCSHDGTTEGGPLTSGPPWGRYREKQCLRTYRRP